MDSRLELRTRARRCGALLIAAASLLGTGVVPRSAVAEPPPGASGEAVGGAVAACDETRARSVAEQVQRRYESIRDLSADFEQRSQSVMLSGASLAGDDLGEGEARTGHVVLAKPGRMNWHYRAPEESRVVSNGELIWIYDVEAAEVSRLPMAEGYLAGAALQFLLGEGKLLEAFEISPKRCENGRVALDLVPKEQASYERLGLVADTKTGEIVETEIVDLLGNRTTIRFTHFAWNQSPPPALFEFEPPPGVEVIDLNLAP